MVKIKEFYPEGWIIDTLENKRKISSPTTLSEAMANKDILLVCRPIPLGFVRVRTSSV